MIEVVLPSGVKLGFPDDTDGDVINEKVRQLIGSDPTPVNVEAPDVKVDVAAPNVTVDVPETQVSVEVAAPDVKVDVEPTPVNVEAPVINVEAVGQDVEGIINAVNAGFMELAQAIKDASDVQHAANVKIIEALNKNAGPRTVIRDGKGLIQGIK